MELLRFGCCCRIPNSVLMRLNHRAYRACIQATNSHLFDRRPSQPIRQQHRPPSKRAKVDAQLKAHIKAFHTRSDGTYGAPRIWKDLMDIDILVGKKRVARLMREMDICGVSRRKSTQTTRKAQKADKAPDLVKRDLLQRSINSGWLTSPTYPLGLASCISVLSWMPSLAASWVGQWRHTCRASWSCQL